MCSSSEWEYAHISVRFFHMHELLAKAADGDRSAADTVKRYLQKLGPIARLAWTTELATHLDPRMRMLSLCFLALAPFPDSIRAGVEAQATEIHERS